MDFGLGSDADIRHGIFGLYFNWIFLFPSHH
jgi:hypothetical protein